jgi:hypothetical protein
VNSAPPFPSFPRSRTVLAVQGSLRRANTARPGPLRAVPKLHIEKGKGATAKVFFGDKKFMNSCQVCWRITEMAQRSNRRFLNLVSVEVLRDRFANREESGRNPSWPGVADSNKGRIHWRRPNCPFQFSLATLRRTIHSDNPS